MSGKIRNILGSIFHELAGQRRSKVLKGHMGSIPIPYVVSSSPKNEVSSVIGYIKGKIAIAVARQFSGKRNNYNSKSFWAREYAVSTIGFEERQIR